MRKILLGAIGTLLIIGGYNVFNNKLKNSQSQITANHLIEKQIKKVGKLIVSEGNYAQIFTYKDSKPLFTDIFTSNKKAIVAVNAKTTISYDLSKLEITVNPSSKTVLINKIPEAELSINPEIEYYDIQEDFFNTFNADDYNTIKNKIQHTLAKEIKQSEVYKNAQNRLITELEKIYILTNTLEWKLEYNQTQITDSSQLNILKL